MKTPLAQLLLLTVLVGIGLWLSIRSFVGSTDDFASSIDARSLGYIRNNTQADPNLVSVTPKDPMSLATFAESESSLATKEELEADAESADDEEKEEDEEDEDDEEDEEAEEEDNNDKVAQEQDREGSSLSEEELAAREKARREKLEKLGLLREEPPELTIAADVSLVMPEECAGAAIAKVPAVLKFRFESSRIMGESRNVLESLLNVYRDCDQGYFTVEENPLGSKDADDTLAQMRLDEVKYFFLQHNISLDIVEFPTER